MVFGLIHEIEIIAMLKTKDLQLKTARTSLVVGLWPLVFGLIHEIEIIAMLKTKDQQLKTARKSFVRAKPLRQRRRRRTIANI
jgi:hypothetical protein